MKKNVIYLAVIMLAIILSIIPVKCQSVEKLVEKECINDTLQKNTDIILDKDSVWFENYIVKPDTLGIVSPDLRRLVFALIYVESKGNDAISNRSGTCIGSLQETKTLVNDVNRILRIWKIKRSYTYNDRKNRVKSIEMFMITVKYYHKGSSWEKIAKAWNQGLGGMYIYPKKAQKYWNLVKDALSKRK